MKDFEEEDAEKEESLLIERRLATIILSFQELLREHPEAPRAEVRKEAGRRGRGEKH